MTLSQGGHNSQEATVCEEVKSRSDILVWQKKRIRKMKCVIQQYCIIMYNNVLMEFKIAIS